MNKLICIFAVVMGMMFTACEKEDVINSETQTKANILTFKSIEEFNNTLVKVNAMSKLERLEWERQQGFKSFGTICDEFYETINYENFSNFEEIKSFVKTNSTRIMLIQDLDGDISCVSQEFDNPERHIMNENGMYIIGNKAYRVFPEAKKVMCDISDIRELTVINDFSQMSNDQNFYFEVTEKSKVNASSNSVDQYFERTEMNSIGSKNYRTIVRVEAVKLMWNSLGMPGGISYAMWFRIRNQSQFIVWWNTDASTKYAPFYYHMSNGTDNFSGSLSNQWGSSFTVNDHDISEYIGAYPYHEAKLSTASPYIVSFEGYVYSTFTRNKQTTTITVNLNY